MIMLSKVGVAIKDLLFPYFCAGCGEEGEWWCEKCRARSPLRPFAIKKEGALDSATALFSYTEQTPISTLIKNFKYNFAEDVKSLWTRIISEAGLKYAKDTIVIPIPLYEKRQRERGFNQAAVIADIVAEEYGLELDEHGLKRIRNTAQQAKLEKENRLTNVRDAFAWAGKASPRCVLLVDDVYTTGATMSECAKILKENGSVTVSGLVLAHG